MTYPIAISGARWIPLTKGQWTLIDESDFELISQYKWYFSPVGKKCGVGGYAERMERQEGRRVKVKLHRQLLGFPNVQVDHKNQDKLDNRRHNLRLATRQENQHNSRIRSDNTSGYKGVCKEGDRWLARVQVNGKQRRIGLFYTAEEAAVARDKAAAVLHGQFATLGQVKS